MGMMNMRQIVWLSCLFDAQSAMPSWHFYRSSSYKRVKTEVMNDILLLCSP